jgi:hypothetical protein
MEASEDPGGFSTSLSPNEYNLPEPIAQPLLWLSLGLIFLLLSLNFGSLG